MSENGVGLPNLVDAKSLYDGVLKDVARALDSDTAQDDSMPGVLENSKGHVTMKKFWDKGIWAAHRSQWRWVRYLQGWRRSTILKSIKLPMLGLLVFAGLVLTINRIVAWLFDIPGPWLRLPQTPLSLQSASIGLILVFRTNQTHDRLREAQKEMGRLVGVQREILEVLTVNVPVAKSNLVCLSARLLALFGWALKAELWHDGVTSIERLVQIFLPQEEAEWLMKQPAPTLAIIFRLRAISGGLYNSGHLDKEAFKFIEDDLAKLGDITSVSSRLTTFPIPPSYHRHGSRAIILWIGALPFALEGKGHTAIETLITVMITGFVILGLDAIALETEQPFDVLPLHEFARNITMDVAVVLRSFCTMPGSALSSLADTVGIAVSEGAEGRDREKPEIADKISTLRERSWARQTTYEMN